jgi:hypothetical protein
MMWDALCCKGLLEQRQSRCKLLCSWFNLAEAALHDSTEGVQTEVRELCSSTGGISENTARILARWVAITPRFLHGCIIAGDWQQLAGKFRLNQFRVQRNKILFKQCWKNCSPWNRLCSLLLQDTAYNEKLVRVYAVICDYIKRIVQWERWGLLVTAHCKASAKTWKMLTILNFKDQMQVAMLNWCLLGKPASVLRLQDKNSRHLFFTNKWRKFCFCSSFKPGYEDVYDAEHDVSLKRLSEAFAHDYARLEMVYKMICLLWHRFRKHNLSIYLTQFTAPLRRFHFDVNELIQTVKFIELHTSSRYTVSELGRDASYIAKVSDMLLFSFHGCVTLQVENNIYIICIKVPRTTIEFKNNFRFIEQFVNFYYEKKVELLDVFNQHYGKEMNLCAMANPLRTAGCLADTTKRIKNALFARYTNRLQVIFDDEAMEVVITCRMVRRKDNAVITTDHSCRYILQEVIERMHLGYAMFDKLVMSVCDMEERLKIIHPHGKFLENWSPDD